jgi:hypothetical protein
MYVFASYTGTAKVALNVFAATSPLLESTENAGIVNIAVCVAGFMRTPWRIAREIAESVTVFVVAGKETPVFDVYVGIVRVLD